jgi:hypothetical protein
MDDRRPVAFALGCLIAAGREMSSQWLGRFALANYALALGLLVPMAGLQFACSAGSSYLFAGQAGLCTVFGPGGAQDPY